MSTGAPATARSGERLPGGERPAEERLDAMLREHGGLLRSVVARVCPRSLGINVDDVAQDARVRLWRAIESEREIASPASYVARVATTAALDAIRRVKARKEEHRGLSEDIVHDDDRRIAAPAARGGDPEELASRRELAAAIERALATVAPARRTAVRLHLQGFSSVEIAALLDWSEPRARNLAYRGLADLKEALRASGITHARL